VVTSPVPSARISCRRRPSWDGRLRSDGGIFSFGAAHFYGSTGNVTLAKPIVGIAASPTGAEY
jgi:hypothetical protein